MNPAINCLKYPETTKEFRNQVTGILMRCLGFLDGPHQYPLCSNDGAVESLIEEFYISTGYSTCSPYESYGVADFYALLLKLNNENFFDFLDICVHNIQNGKLSIHYCTYDELISELNNIMKMNGVDLKIEDGHCIRISEPTIQEEVITPAFVELKKKGFKNAQSELWKSFDFFKKGNNREAIHSANNALEAAIGYIVEDKGLDSKNDKNDRMKIKLERLVKSGVLPKEYESNFNALITLLQTSSVIRNKHGGHGTADENPVADLYVQYAIDSAASAILFLVRLYH